MIATEFTENTCDLCHIYRSSQVRSKDNNVIQNFYQNFATLSSTLIIAFCFAGTTSNVQAEDKEDRQMPTLLETFAVEFVPITPGKGKFPKSVVMGSSVEVTLTNSFSIAKYEVYQNLYETVMESNPSRWKGPRNSAESMTFAEAKQFCEKVTRLLRQHKFIKANQVVRLPTEVEWEYCARAGTTTAYSFGDKARQDGDIGNKATLLDPYAWHTGNAAGNDPAVGVLKPNPWGLYDVHGYLSEFCLDDWTPTLSKVAASAHAPVANKSDQVAVRSGSWKDPYTKLTSSFRRPFPKSGRDDAFGFRCVLIEE